MRWALPRKGERKPIPLLTTEFNALDARSPPAGGWVAYSLDESGQDRAGTPYPLGGSVSAFPRLASVFLL